MVDNLGLVCESVGATEQRSPDCVSGIVLTCSRPLHTLDKGMKVVRQGI